MSGKHYHDVEPGIPRPSAVVIVEQEGGAFLIQGYPTGVSIYVRAEDAWRLREVLDEIFAGAKLYMDVPPVVRPRI